MSDIRGNEGINFLGKRGVNAADPIHDKDVVNLRSLKNRLSYLSGATLSGVSIVNIGQGYPVYAGQNVFNYQFRSFSAFGPNLLLYTGDTITYALNNNLLISGLTASTITAGTIDASQYLSAGTPIEFYLREKLWCGSTGNQSIIRNNYTNNLASGNFSIIAGAYSDNFGDFSAIGGGSGNTIYKKYSFIGGGLLNYSSGISSTIVGGSHNKTFGQHSFIGGGFGNYNYKNFGFVGGGFGNIQYGNFGVSVGGNSNSGLSDYTVIVGGSSNAVYSGFSVQVGGYKNISKAQFSSGINGLENKNYQSFSTVINGSGNTIIGTGKYATVLNGINNIVNTSGNHNIIAGNSNVIYNININLPGKYNTILNGRNNLIYNSSYYASILNGTNNQVRNGSILSTVIGSNTSVIDSSLASFIIGGFYNYLKGNYSSIVGGFGLNLFANNTTAVPYLRITNTPYGGSYMLTVDPSGYVFKQGIPGGGAGGGTITGAVNTGATHGIYAGLSGSSVLVFKSLSGRPSIIITSSLTENAISVAPNLVLNSLTASTISGTSISGSTLFSGSTDLSFYFRYLWTSSTGSNSIIANNNTQNLGSGSFALIAGRSNTGGSTYSFVANGKTNLSNSLYSVVINGLSNTALTKWSTVINGNQNIASGITSFVGGGYYNKAYGLGSFIGSGQGNKTKNNRGAIVAGVNNSAYTIYSFIGAGSSNLVNGTRSSILGGINNRVFSQDSNIGGGNLNFLSSNTNFSSILGGELNQIFDGRHSNILGGLTNIILCTNSYFNSIVSGLNNRISGSTNAFVSILNGNRNSSYANKYISILNGNDNILTGSTQWTTILNGSFNKAINTRYSLILGTNHTARTGSHILIIGGVRMSGSGNFSTSINSSDGIVSGWRSLLVGSSYSHIHSNYSFGMGFRNTAETGSHNFVFGNRNASFGGSNILLGGIRNSAITANSIIIGGEDSFNNGNASIILGGTFHHTTGQRALVGGFTSNSATTIGGVVIGGRQNSVINNSTYGFIATGSGNTISRITNGFIGGGKSNYIRPVNVSIGASIINGINNYITGVYSRYSILGNGKENKVSGSYNSLINGFENIISGITDGFAFIGSGRRNRIQQRNGYNAMGTIINGSGNTLGSYGGAADISSSFIGNGISNYSNFKYSFIGTGKNLSGINAAYTVALNGVRNISRQKYSSIINGFSNTGVSFFGTVINGKQNIVTGNYGLVFGSGNTAQGNYSFVFGQNNRVNGSASSILAGRNYTLTASNTALVGGLVIKNAPLGGTYLLTISPSGYVYKTTGSFGSSFVGNISGATNLGVSPSVGFYSNQSLNRLNFKSLGSGSNILITSSATINTVALAPNISVTTLTASTLSATTISGATIISGTTNLYNIFAPFGSIAGSQTIIRNGLNTYTGGSSGDYTVNVSALTINTLNASGNSVFTGTLSGGSSFSANTIFSGTSNLDALFITQNQLTNSQTFVQPGINTYTGGTPTNPTVNVSALTINTLIASGNSIFTGTLSGGSSFSANTLFSGTSNLDTLFITQNQLTNSQTFVQPGTNIYTGGTSTRPTVNFSGGSINDLNISGQSNVNVLSATTLSASSVFIEGFYQQTKTAFLSDAFSTTSGSLTDVTGLAFSVGAFEVWQFEISGQMSGSTANGQNHALSIPSGAFLNAKSVANTNSVTAFRTSVLNANNQNTSTIGTAANTLLGFEIKGIVSGSTSAGNVQFRFFSNTAGNTSTIQKGTYLLANRIS